MANPTSNWDKVPIFGWYMELDGSTPKVGQVRLTLGQRVNTQSSFHTTFPGGTVTATIGDTSRADLVNQIRAAMSAVDQAAVEATGGTFDAAAWGAAWDAKLPAAFFTDFPASDDPDIIGQGYEVKVEEKLTSGDGKIYYITPKLSDLSKPIPGVNLGEVDVPPGSPTAPAPIYQKGQPGGVAPLDDNGLVPLVNLPANIGSGGVSSWNDLQDKPAVIAAGADAATARAVIGAADVNNVVPADRTINGKPLSNDVTLSAADVGAASTASLALKADASTLSAHVSNVSNPHAVTKTQVGLGNVDNTADTDKPVSTATQAALATRINFRGDYAANTVYALNDVVNSPGAGRWRVIQAHTSAGPAPTSENPYWTIFGGNSSVVIGTGPGQAADASTVVPNTRKINGKALSADFSLAASDVGALGSGYAGAVTGTRFTVLWVSGSGWPTTRPSSRMDIYFDWLDTTGESTDTDIPSAIINGDTISRFTATGTVTTVAYRSSSTVGPNQSINYLATPLQLPAPAGLQLGDYYMVAVLFGSIASGAGFIAPAGFARLTPAGASGQDFGVYGYKMQTSSDLTAAATTAWSPNSTQASRGQAVGVALQGVGSVGTPTAITYANPITSPFTPATVTGDATFQVMYTGNTSTSSHPVHASVGGTLLAQVMAESGTPDPQSDNVLSISMNGTGVSWSPSAIYGGGTNIPVTKG